MPIDRELIRQRMAALAAADKDFAYIVKFFTGLQGLTKAQFVDYSRTRLPGVADVLGAKLGSSSELLWAMKQAPCKSDEEVVALVAKLLESVTKGIEISLSRRN